MEIGFYCLRLEASLTHVVLGHRTYKDAYLSEKEVDELIGYLKALKSEVWPKPLAPLCPASRELLSYLRKYGAVTPLKAREELGIEHLPRRIKDIKEHGYAIKTEYMSGHSGKRYAKYVLEGSV